MDTRSTAIWHKASINISTGITPSNTHHDGTTLSSKTCIPVISRHEESRRHILSRQKTSLFLVIEYIPPPREVSFFIPLYPLTWFNASAHFIVSSFEII